MKADYPVCFINSVINEFQKDKDHGDGNFVIPPDTEIPYSMKLNQNIL